MDAFIGEIRAFPYSFVPADWAECNGQAMPIQQYAGLFSIIGTAFGGNGSTTFNLPDLRGSAAMGAGTDNQGNSYSFGKPVGTGSVTLAVAQMPTHNHALQTQSSPPMSGTPGPAVIPTDPQYAGASGPVGYLGYASHPALLVPMATGALGAAGQGQPHDNHSPYLVLRWCISLEGNYPIRPS